MVILVTGATGFLGAHLVSSLQDRRVIATGRNRDKLQSLAAVGATVIPLDLTQAVTAHDLDRIGAIDAVVHCAGLSSPWGQSAAFMAANVDGTRHAVQMAAALGARRFVMVSTASVYFRFADQDRLTEHHKLPLPVNHYAKTKRLAEMQALAQSDVGPVVIRPRGIYGAGDTALLPRLLRVAGKRALPLFSSPGATDITHVDDVVAAIKIALDAGPEIHSEIVNVTGGVGLSLPDIVTGACRGVGFVPRWRRMPFKPVLSVARGMEMVAGILPGRPEPPLTAYTAAIFRYRQTLDIGKAKTLLGWTPQVSFEDGLARTFKNGAMRPGVIC